MIDGLRPYPEYRESGLPWAPRVPGHWGVERGKSLFNKMNRPVRSSDDVVTCFRDGTVTLRKLRRTSGYTEAILEFGYQGIRRGDLVIHGMDAFAGAAGVSDSDGKGTPVYSVCEPRHGVNAKYFAHVVRLMGHSLWILALSRGIRERSSDFRFEVFGKQDLPLPPPDEQAAIVRFLDHANRRIDGFIRAKRKLIALLNEQKQAIIHRAVTRGLDPGVPMKDSGVPWIGEIPAHWEVERAKCLFREVDIRSKDGSESLLSVSHLAGVVPRSSRNITMFMARTYAGHKLCQPGDLVVNTMWAWMGALGVSAHDGIVSPSYAVYRPVSGSPLLGAFAELLFHIPPYIANFLARSTGLHASRLRLYPDQFLALRVLCPPVNEQRRLIAYVDQETGAIRSATQHTTHELALLREYRTRLISDVVTGQLDVRAAAASLPADAPEPEPETVDDLDADPADDEDASDEEIDGDDP